LTRAPIEGEPALAVKSLVSILRLIHYAHTVVKDVHAELAEHPQVQRRKQRRSRRAAFHRGRSG
jgi:hypothetical protein